MARWVRLHAWYDFQRFKIVPNSKLDQDFSNCFADFEAAFLASYTHYLLTADKGQQKAARAIRPDLQIWEWDHRGHKLRRVASA
jgi:hypothetical protein